MSTFQLNGWFADFARQEFYYGSVKVVDGRIDSINETGERRLTWKGRQQVSPIILPGLVDAHVHIESSMILPSRFAAQAVRFGTVATVSDPHEIANVLGIEGVRIMLEDAEKACIKIHFTAPSCVPATPLESAGAVLTAQELEPLFREDRIVALGEMMNYPGVLGKDPEVMAKIQLAGKYGRPVDGHAPGLTGEELLKYIQAGISTDHECSTQEEAVEKISAGMQILIREGSSARNFEALRPLIDQYPGQVMLCTDDYHPDDLMKGHIDRLIRRGVEEGTGFFNIYKAASLNPVSFYRLPCGTLNPGDPADFLVASSLDPFTVKATYINGTPVFNGQKSCGSLPEAPAGNAFQAKPVTPADLKLEGSEGKYKVIRVYDGELLTGSETAWISAPDGILTPDTHSGIQKIVVLNRYKPAKPAIAFIRGFELKEGALASTIAHDSHNIIAVGCSDVDIADAINAVIREKGGISAASGREVLSLPLPVAGLMTTTSAEEAARGYANMNRFAQLFGSTLKAPFMALSFMALLVIPHLKIGDRGLFDCDTFSFTSLKAE